MKKWPFLGSDSKMVFWVVANFAWTNLYQTFGIQTNPPKLHFPSPDLRFVILGFQSGHSSVQSNDLENIGFPYFIYVIISFKRGSIKLFETGSNLVEGL